MKFHHIGIATDNIEATIAYLKAFFIINHISEVIHDDKQNADLCMVTTENLNIELIAGEITKNILKKRQYLYHTCYEVEDIELMLERLVKEGAFLISPAKPAILFNEQKVAFLSTKLGIVELLEVGKSK